MGSRRLALSIALESVPSRVSDIFSFNGLIDIGLDIHSNETPSVLNPINYFLGGCLQGQPAQSFMRVRTHPELLRRSCNNAEHARNKENKRGHRPPATTPLCVSWGTQQKSSILSKMFWKGCPKIVFLLDPGPNRSSGPINRTKYHEISIKTDGPSPGVWNPISRTTKFELFSWCSCFVCLGGGAWFSNGPRNILGGHTPHQILCRLALQTLPNYCESHR